MHEPMRWPKASWKLCRGWSILQSWHAYLILCIMCASACSAGRASTHADSLLHRPRIQSAGQIFSSAYRQVEPELRSQQPLDSHALSLPSYPAHLRGDGQRLCVQWTWSIIGHFKDLLLVYSLARQAYWRLTRSTPDPYFPEKFQAARAEGLEVPLINLY